MSLTDHLIFQQIEIGEEISEQHLPDPDSMLSETDPDELSSFWSQVVTDLKGDASWVFTDDDR